MSEPKMDAFHEFLNKRFDYENKEDFEPSEIKADYFESRTRAILEALCGRSHKQDALYEDHLREKKIGLVTVRRAFNRDSILLKPVATFPNSFLATAHEFARQIVPQTFANYREALERIPKEDQYTPLDDKEDSVSFSAVYTTRGGLTPNKSKSKLFRDRIDVAFERLREREPFKTAKESTCFFSVKARLYEEGGQIIGLRIAQIAAIYFIGKKTISWDQGEAAHQLCLSMFDEHDRIRELEENFFILEGHKLTASLQPLFLNDKIAPADKIAFAVEKLKRLLTRHFHSLYPVPIPVDHDTSVYFVSLAYEVPDSNKNEEVIPSFQVYPHVYRRSLAYGAFLIGHPSRPAISKYLLRKYLRSKKTENCQPLKFLVGAKNCDKKQPNPAKIHNCFMKQLFREVDGILAKAVKDAREGIRFLKDGPSDQVYLSKVDQDEPDPVWEALNVDVGSRSLPSGKREDEETTVGETKSILAYVIEGHDVARHKKVVYRQLPRAILAIESTHSEMLSEKERDSMRQVAKSFSHLVRHIFHDNTLLDYRRQLSTAYEDYANPTEQKPDHLGERFLLSAMSIDVRLLEEIMEAAKDDSGFNGYLIKIHGIYESVFEGTAYDDQAMTGEDVVEERIDTRFERAVSYIKENGHPTVEEVEFLEACPRNFAWAGYAPSLAQALGDRADHKPPRFKLMTPGFSASGLYMAVVEDEIRQVAKLSRVDKLMKERENYRQHVRYKVLVAARSPAKAFAFDSTGSDGKNAGNDNKMETYEPGEGYTEKCYGVLVADLASSKRLDPEGKDPGSVPGNEKETEVATFLDRVIEVVKTENRKTFGEVVQSIRALFENNFGHWFSTTTQDECLPLPILRAGFRLDYEKLHKQKKPKGPPAVEATTLTFKRLTQGDKESTVFHEQDTFPLEFNEAEREDKNLESACIAPNQIAYFCCFRSNLGRPLNAKEKEKLISIAHRDLNAQNLVWAGPIQSFIMIDFEHTGIGYWGMDQARLAVNTVVDFLSKSTEPDESYNPFSEVSNAANFLVDAWYSFESANAWDAYWVKDLGDTPLCSTPPEKGKKLAGIVRLVIWLIWQNVQSFRDRNFLEVYQLELGYAVVKEYEYSMINVRRARLNNDQRKAVRKAMLDKGDDLEKLLESVHNALFGESNASDKRLRLDPRLGFQFAAVSRFLVSRWILKKLVENGNDRSPS